VVTHPIDCTHLWQIGAYEIDGLFSCVFLGDVSVENSMVMVNLARGEG
jgi:hypothetical protein